MSVRNGVFPYGMYCDCWQSVLSDMIGPHRKRRSRIVTFVDPERIDVPCNRTSNFHPRAFLVLCCSGAVKLEVSGTAQTLR